MVLDFKRYSADIDAEKTRAAYQHMFTVDAKCSCTGCRNYAKAIKPALGTDGMKLFRDMGIDDPAEATEVYVNCCMKNGLLLYGGFYHLFGRIRKNSSYSQDIKKELWRQEMTYDINENIYIYFSDNIDLKEEVFDGELVQMEFVAALPWTISDPNDYPCE